MDKEKKTLGSLQKGESLARIATALEHIAFYLAEIVNNGKIK